MTMACQNLLFKIWNMNINFQASLGTGDKDMTGIHLLEKLLSLQIEATLKANTATLKTMLKEYPEYRFKASSFYSLMSTNTSSVDELEIEGQVYIDLIKVRKDWNKISSHSYISTYM